MNIWDNNTEEMTPKPMYELSKSYIILIWKIKKIYILLQTHFIDEEYETRRTRDSPKVP